MATNCIDCDQPAKSQRMCNQHYHLARREGIVLPTRFDWICHELNHLWPLGDPDPKEAAARLNVNRDTIRVHLNHRRKT